MNKTKLERFILKYNLNDNVDSVKWCIKDNKLFTSFSTNDRSVAGNVSVDNFNFESIIFGVYSTKQLQRLLNVLGDNIDLSLLKVDKKAISLRISDSIASVNFTLADLSIISDPPKVSKDLLSQPDAIIDIDNKFIDAFIKGKNALPDADTFTILDDGTNDNLKIVIGYSSTINTNKVTILVPARDKLFPDSLSFNAEIFKEILLANKECMSATLRISCAKGGLAYISFKMDDYFAEYYLSAVQSN